MHSRIRSLISYIILSIFCVTTSSNCQSEQRTLTLMPMKEGREWIAFSLNSSFLQMMRDLFDIKVFVESGTYFGNSAALAASLFNKVHTIELSGNLVQQARVRFAHIQQVTVHHGDSASVLPDILHGMHERALFWLDGHWSGGNTAQGPVNTPILEELLAIEKSGIKDGVILIDDIRYFQAEGIANNKNPALCAIIVDYPPLSTLVERIKRINPEYTCVLYGDALLAYTDKNIMPTPLMRAMTMSRLNQDSNELLDWAEKTISEADQYDAARIKALYEEGGWDEAFNQYYQFWYGLTLLRTDNDSACKLFLKALHGGCGRARRYVA